jgi:metalloendopeptidase OMA1, mitochondrial
MSNRARLIPILAVILIAVFTYFNSEKFTNPETGKTVRVALSEDQEAQLGLQSYKQVIAESQGQLQNTGPEYDRVVRVARRLAQSTGDAGKKFQWAVSLLRSNQVNAFCLPGGKIVVYTGILPVAENDAQLATVMGHEMAHATSRHGSQRLLRDKLTQTVLSGAQFSLAGMDWNQQQAVMGALGAATQYGATLPFSRENEEEADYIGLLYMARAGYDPREAIKFWQRMSKSAGAGQKPPEFASTHPSDETRIGRLNEEMAKAVAEYEKSPFRGQP